MRLHRRHLHACRRGLRRLTVVLTLLLGGLEALAQLSLPLLAWQPQWIAYELGRQLHTDVRFRSLRGHWHLSGPDFVMKQVTITPKDGNAPLQLGEVELKLDFGGWMPGRHWINMYGRDLSLSLIYAADGSWHLAGFGSDGKQGRRPMSLGRLGVGLWLQDLKLDIIDEGRGKTFTLIADALRLSKEGIRVRFGARLHRADAQGFVLGAGWFSTDARRGRLWMSGQNMVLDDVMAGVDLKGYRFESGQGAWEAWLNWQDTHFDQAQMRLDLDRLVLLGPQQRRSVVNHLHGEIAIERHANDISLRWAGDDKSMLDTYLARDATGLTAVRVKAQALNLQPLVPWLAQLSDLPPALSTWLGQGRPHGWLRHAKLNWQRASGLRSADLRFDGLGIDPVGSTPGLDALRGVIVGNDQAIILELPDQALNLREDAAAAAPLPLSHLRVQARLLRTAQGHALELEQLAATGDGLKLEAQGRVGLPRAGNPIADLHFALPQLDIAALKRIWPVAAGKYLEEWVHEALLGGSLAVQGQWRGDLHRPSGLVVHAKINDLGLRYAEHWPEVDGLHGELLLHADNLTANFDAGRSDGVFVDHARLRIPSFNDPVLDIDLQAHSHTRDALDFITHTSVAEDQASLLGKMQFGGSMQVGMHLTMSLKGDKDIQLQGQGHLAGMNFAAPDWKLAFANLSGPFRFDQHGFAAGPLRGQTHGEPVQIHLGIGAATGDPERDFTASLHGRFRFDQLAEGYDFLHWLNPLGQGSADFDLGVDIRKEPPGQASKPLLWLNSSLRGIALRLPAPLDKPAAAALPLHLQLPLPVEGAMLQVQLGTVAQGLLRLPESEQQALVGNVRLGGPMPSQLPLRGLRFEGRADRFDASGWLGFATAADGKSSTKISLDGVDIQARQAEFFGAAFPHTHLQVQPQGERMQVALAGPKLQGHIEARMGARPEIQINLQRLYWPHPAPAPASASSAAAAQDPATAAVTARHSAPAADEPHHGDETNPAKVPALHLHIADFRYGEADFGMLRMESRPLSDGMRIELLHAAGGQIILDGQGTWRSANGMDRSQMQLHFDVNNLGDAEVALGYPRWFQGGSVKGQLALSWPGAPVILEPSQMDGKLSFKLEHGQLINLPPGIAARLLSLFSIAELPRRLGLDFRDVFGQGLHFDRIAGEVNFAGGNAYTPNLTIKSPPAKVVIRGRVGLAARDYDADVQIQPHLSRSLPLVGGVAGGPIGLAAAFAVEELFGHSINQAAMRRYHLSGSWDQPQLLPWPSGASPKVQATVPMPAAQSGAAL